MVQNPKYWRTKKFDKTPLGNVNKKSHFSSKLCFVLESGTIFCSPVFWILYHVTSSCKGPILAIITLVPNTYDKALRTRLHNHVGQCVRSRMETQ